MKLAAALAVALLAALASPDARAYPQWQLTSGASRCNSCHFAPAGGGLPNARGSDASAEELATFPGDGNFLHGQVVLPRWLALGGDFRGAFAAHDVGDPNGSTQAFFPMQADLLARVALPAGLSIYLSGGLRGQVRDDEDLVPLQNYQPITASRLISREHWLSWQPSAQGIYLRAGRFYAPYGLRLAEHVTYVRRDLGFHLLEESYNLSGGYLSDRWELHATAFAPDFVRHIGSQEAGGALYLEGRGLGDRGTLAVQARFADRDASSRLIGGLVAKYHIAPLRTLLLGEGNFVNLRPDGVAGSWQFVGAAGLAVLPVRGLMVTLLGERSHEDLRVRDAAWNTATALVSWFPGAHCELQLMARLQKPTGSLAARTLFLQLHYFL